MRGGGFACQAVELVQRQPQSGRHLIQERAGSACACFVHAQFLTARQIENLCVFSAKLNGRVHRMAFSVFCGGILEVLSGGNHFLHEADAETFAQRKGAGAGQANPRAQMRIGAHQILQKRNKRGSHGTCVTLVGVCQDGAVGTEQDVLDGSTAQVNTQAKCF